MSLWEKKCEFSQPKAEPNMITSVSVSKSGDMVCAGTLSGQVFVFEQRKLDGCWDHVFTWEANTKCIDVKMQKEVNPMVIDTDLFMTHRKSPILITAGIRDIHVWFISDKYEPAPDPEFTPHGLQFPSITSRKRYINANEIALIQSKEGKSFASVRACSDGMTMAFTEDKNLYITRIDHLDCKLSIFSNTHTLSRLDFLPNSCDIIITGDSFGSCHLLDLRINPHITTPQLTAAGNQFIDGTQSSVADCRFSPDGNLFFARYNGDVMFWDVRNAESPVAVVPIISKDQRRLAVGNEVWRGCWADQDTVCAGIYGGELKLVGTGGVNDIITTSTRKHRLFSFRDRGAWERSHAVCTVDVAPGSPIAAASNGQKLFIFNRR